MTVSPIRNLSAFSVKDLPAPPAGKWGWPWTVGSKLLPNRRSDGSEWPRLSIVTPSYNQGQFLEMTIRSVLLQGYPNLEYIIIDGGSDDGSVEILRKYERFLGYWISEADQGQSDAINKGLAKSSGELIGWLNSDDIYVKGAFQIVANSFLENEDCIVVHGNRILLDEFDHVMGVTPVKAFEPHKTLYNVLSETAFWRKKAMEKAGHLKSNLRFAMDLEFFSRLYTYGKFYKTGEYLGYFRIHPASKSSTLEHVYREESKREWENIFPIEWHERLPRPSKFIYLRAMLAHPYLIGGPYFINRVRKYLRKNF
jgi:glycosyltransferase involved in cell wall biosynthesis